MQQYWPLDIQASKYGALTVCSNICNDFAKFQERIINISFNIAKYASKIELSLPHAMSYNPSLTCCDLQCLVFMLFCTQGFQTANFPNEKQYTTAALLVLYNQMVWPFIT